jgi:hypothetical protein
VNQARNTATNPAALEAFALAIMSADSPATYSGELIKNPDVEYAKEEAGRIAKAMEELKRVAPMADRIWRRVIISKRTGRNLSGVPITRGCAR